MNIKYRSILVLLFLSSLLFSCIEEFRLTQTDESDFTPNMVIEGHILSGDLSIVYVTQTVPTGTIERPEAVINALVTIIGENGYETEKAEFDIENDRYVIPTYNLPRDTKYALKIEVDGQVYQSEFQEIQKTNQIDEVYYKETENEVDIYISSYGQKSNSPYYMWTYEEDWEIHPYIDVTKEVRGFWQYNKTFYPELEEAKKNSENPYYNCWGKNYSSMIHIYDTNKLSENSVKGHKLLSIPIDDNRISYLYSILVKQAGLDENGYKYYHTLKRYTEESSGLFTPMPTEVKGNVSCITNPQTKVIGYVIASQISTKRIFIDTNDLNKEALFDGFCSISEGSEADTYAELMQMAGAWVQELKNGALIWNERENEISASSLLYSRPCIDCRAIPYATQKRPDFWPTDHE